jgi:citrate lyase subunit beta/citryl-CoA lyase
MYPIWGGANPKLVSGRCSAGCMETTRQAIETVYPAFTDLTGLSEYAGRAARDGFTEMMAIRPDQIAIINAAFTPAPELVAQACRIVEACKSQPYAGVLRLAKQ